MRGRWRGKEEILPRKSHDAMKRATIFLCFLFSFVPLKFHAILVTRSETLVTQATGFHVFPLEISCKDFSLSSPTCFLRLQNSPYFCVFKYARAVKQRAQARALPRFTDFFTDFEKKKTTVLQPSVFSSRPIKSLIVTPLFAIARVGIKIGRILIKRKGGFSLPPRLSLVV